MSLQYITDSNGKTTGVFIPISEWNKIKTKYNDIDSGNTDIPQWQMDEVSKRLEEYDENPDIALDFDTVMDEIDNEA